METTAADPLIGQVLNGRYLVRSHVARGGMATVYAGHDTKLDRTVAIKVMHAGLAADQEFVRRFIGEAKHAAALSHPNVVAVYDQGADNGQVFLVMEYVPGRTARALLTERGRLGPREALGVMQPVLAALGAAHRAGLVHRDVKPENVLLTEDGQVKVADFGLARAETASRQTRTGMIIGTVGYLAPEQVLSGEADARTDVYAAGIMLFELLTGHQPYQAGTPLAVAYMHVNEVVPPPSSLIAGLPPQLDALVVGATDRDPARRPPDADRFHAAVAEAVRALPPEDTMRNLTVNSPSPPVVPYGATQGLNPHTMAIPAHEVPAPPALRERLMRPPGLYGLLAACAVLVLVLAGVVVQTAGNTKHVPKLVGLSETDARLQADKQDLKVKIGSARYDPGVPRDKVAAVQPAAGTEVKKGAVLTLILSRGNRPVTVPNVVNQQLDQARQRLRQAGLRPGEQVRKASTTVPAGHVIGTVPPAGKKQDPADPVTLVVSSGITMPDLTNLTPDQAAQKLARLGLNVHWQRRDPAGGQRPNTVIGQNPHAGRHVSRGDNVQVTVTKNKGRCRGWNPFCKKGHGGDQDEG
ncbi:Stk1 family PASTA domain-containing Ser/Thr kinase [Actinoallomurus iriomotensis]|uniref:non-specific serine/threonine protein kinase n=1 Tax=Actinoallomurus iriomotensis TaxID=478107 RepID=A0A9W6S9S2_9ACTN|nr:Stk1 family PASTA domain-containing Ser/Thr kinase [Actinoallomurus iriomotensis]GLY89658.1 serine/threonine protein kinase [Actinoallomurus iriomotensis]